MKIAAAAMLAAMAASAAFAQPRIVYSKDFPGSVPPFALITVERDGKSVYKESPTDDQPVEFQLTQAEVDQIFALAEKVDRFRKPLEAESKVKVANMGMKTLRWEEDGTQPSEVKLNYTTDPDGAALLDWFDRIILSELQFIALDRTVHFDKLGAYQVLLTLEAAYDRDRIVAASQYLPLLDRIAKNATFLNAARERASALAATIRNPATPASPEQAEASPPAADAKAKQ